MNYYIIRNMKTLKHEEIHTEHLKALQSKFEGYKQSYPVTKQIPVNKSMDYMLKRTKQLEWLVQKENKKVQENSYYSGIEENYTPRIKLEDKHTQKNTISTETIANIITECVIRYFWFLHTSKRYILSLYCNICIVKHMLSIQEETQ